MGFTILYYFLGFIFFIGCLGGIQMWVKMPQQKKDKVGIIVLSIFLVSMLTFVYVIFFKPTFFNAETTMSGIIVFVFLLIVFTAFFIFWYNAKYNKKVNAASIIIVMSLSIFGFAYFILKNMGSNEKEKLVKNISLKTVVTNITFDTHKPYFKDMTLADGQFLSMPETMNNTLQIGDSIYKIKRETFYTVVNFKTKLKTQYAVATHVRVLGKPQ